MPGALAGADEARESVAVCKVAAGLRIVKSTADMAMTARCSAVLRESYSLIVSSGTCP